LGSLTLTAAPVQLHLIIWLTCA